MSSEKLKKFVICEIYWLCYDHDFMIFVENESFSDSCGIRFSLSSIYPSLNMFHELMSNNNQH